MKTVSPSLPQVLEGTAEVKAMGSHPGMLLYTASTPLFLAALGIKPRTQCKLSKCPDSATLAASSLNHSTLFLMHRHSVQCLRNHGVRKQKHFSVSHTDHQVFECELLSASLSNAFSKSAMIWLKIKYGFGPQRQSGGYGKK